MLLEGMEEAAFLERPNRFLARVRFPDGREETIHVKNTGRCRELLKPEARVMVCRSSSPNRKTAYDLISVYKEGTGWANIDSQLANRLMEEWLTGLESSRISRIQREKKTGNSRFDFLLELQQEKETAGMWLEVKSCTLECNGIGYFPDAPTLRGIRHLEELSQLAEQGKKCAVCFVAMIEGVCSVHPNTEHDPAFAAAFEHAVRSGVEIWHAECIIQPERAEIKTVRRQTPMQLLPVQKKSEIFPHQKKDPV